MSNEVFVIQLEALAEGLVAIRIRPQNEQLEFDKAQEQGLLALIKGSIN